MHHSDSRVLAWEGGQTEKDMRLSHAQAYMCMCVRVCVCAKHIGLNNSTSKPSLGLATFQKLFFNQAIVWVCIHPLSAAWTSEHVGFCFYSESQLIPCVWNNVSHLRIRPRHCPVAVSSADRANGLIICGTASFSLSMAGSRTWAHHRCFTSFDKIILKIKTRWVLRLNCCNSKNRLSEAMGVEGIHYHQQNLCVLSCKDMKDTGLGITRSGANSPKERTQRIHRRIQLNPASNTKLGTTDIKMKK